MTEQERQEIEKILQRRKLDNTLKAVAAVRKKEEDGKRAIPTQDYPLGAEDDKRGNFLNLRTHYKLVTGINDIDLEKAINRAAEDGYVPVNGNIEDIRSARFDEWVKCMIMKKTGFI